jgi:hypothetical protein
MYYILSFTLLLYACSGCVTSGETGKYKIGGTNWPNGEFFLLNAKDDTIKKLEKHEYQINFSGDFDKFAVLGIKGERGWCAIDIHENILFRIANFPLSELWSPDNFVEDRIRIIDESGKYGFANTKGKIVIQPKFELVSQFKNGFAIILEDCHNVYWEDNEEADHEEHGDCNHFSIECNKHGYINKKGKIIKLGHFTFEEIKKEIGWEWPD